MISFFGQCMPELDAKVVSLIYFFYSVSFFEPGSEKLLKNRNISH